MENANVSGAATALLKLAVAILEDSSTFDDLAAELAQMLGLPVDDVITADALSEIAEAAHSYVVDCLSPFFLHREPSHRERFARRLAEAFVKYPELDWQATMDIVWTEGLPASGEAVQ